MSTALEAAARDQLDAAVTVVRLHVVEGHTIADAAKAAGITRAKAESALRVVHRYLTSTLAEASATPSRNARTHPQR